LLKIIINRKRSEKIEAKKILKNFFMSCPHFNSSPDFWQIMVKAGFARKKKPRKPVTPKPPIVLGKIINPED
jgi:hypothetical protein